jgi:soluble lytic murein transglycosylase-like protein
MSGPLAGARFPLRAPVTRLGRARENDIVLQGADAAIVSAQHCEIRLDGESYKLVDLDSTNGTFLNGNRVSEAKLEESAIIQLGPGGPEFTLTAIPGEAKEPEASDLNATIVARGEKAVPLAGTISDVEEKMLREAVTRARSIRQAGAGDQTTLIMRDMLRAALRRSRKRLKRVIAVLAAGLVGVSAAAGWRIYGMRQEKSAIDVQIRELEARLARVGQDSPQADALIAQLSEYQDQGRALERQVLYRIGIRENETLVEREIKTLLAEFGAEVYRVPPEFHEHVNRFLARYQGPDRPHIESALGHARPVMDRIRRILEEHHLPPDLAHIVLVESALDSAQESTAAAAGLWQFTPATARGFGLKVGDGVDERLDTVKSTRAASRYIRELILDFGAGSSVMLALAAYNVGPGRVKQAIRKQVQDPIKQRSFWYLYRVRALPAETREYVPKVFAAMLIGRNPEKFGF